MTKKQEYQEYRKSLPDIEKWKAIKKYKGKSLSSYYRYRKLYSAYINTSLSDKLNSLGGWKEVGYSSPLAVVFDDVYGDNLENLIPSGVSILNSIAKQEDADYYKASYHQPVILSTEHGIEYKK